LDWQDKQLVEELRQAGILPQQPVEEEESLEEPGYGHGV